MVPTEGKVVFVCGPMDEWVPKQGSLLRATYYVSGG